MDSVRMAPGDSDSALAPCCRCQEGDRRWDRIAGKVICPSCQEALARGEGEPLIERLRKHRCAICHEAGTVAFLTFPLNQPVPVEIDLCPEHLRGLVGRRLAPQAYHQLRRCLRSLGLAIEDIFLLHEAFYDVHGRALQPAVAVDL